MALEVWTNDGTGTVTSGGTTAPASGTVESWTVNVTTAFPVASSTASPPASFYVADAATAHETEKILVTVCPGGTGSAQSWTVTRGADGTAPVAHTTGFTIQNVVTGASLRGVQRAGLPLYYYTDFGIMPDGGTTDNGPIINAAFKALWNSGNGQGGIIVLPQCGFQAGGNTSVTTYSTLIIPPYCGLVGMGKQKTMIRLGPGANCDVIQFMRAASTTTLSAPISGTITSIPVAALPADIIPGGTVQVVNGSSQTQNFTVTSAGAAQGATSIPVTSTAVSHTFTTGNTVYDATQAVLTGAAPSAMQNCFYGRIEGLTVHGSWNFQTPGTYRHGINATTYPLLTAAGSDPDFDPYNFITDVECRYASGDGLFANGRSGLQVTSSLFRYNQGNGITPSFDSLYDNIDIGFNGIAGIYQNHGSTSGSGKVYNNGNIPQWVSGGTYTYNAGTGSMSLVMYAGAVYACKLSVSGSATTPAADTTHWAAVTATSPQAWGYDGYWDSNAYEAVWRLDSQEPTAGSFYFNQATGCTLTGVSNRPNFDNPGSGSQAGSNPNNYGAVTLDGAVGCNVEVAYNAFGSVCYALKTLNSPSHNNVIMAGDTTAQGNSLGTLTGNYVLINGSVLSGGGSGGMSQVAQTALAGYTLVNGTGDIITWTAPADGALHSAVITGMLLVTSNETGGQIIISFTAPDNSSQAFTLFGAGQSATGGAGGSGYYGFQNGGPQLILPVYPGGTVTVSQNNALTAGAAKLYATILAA